MNREEFNTLGNVVAHNTWQNIEVVDHSHEIYFWWMQQHQEEFWSLLDKLQQNGTKTVLEIGSSHGGCITFYDRMVGPGGLVIGMEAVEEYGFSVQKLGDPVSVAEQVLLIANSHYPESVTKVKEALGGRPLDFLFIDGDHSYEGAKQDYEMFGPLVRSGGIIGFHDVAIDPRVRQFFDEIPGQKEILPVYFQGIGLIFKA